MDDLDKYMSSAFTLLLCHALNILIVGQIVQSKVIRNMEPTI
jgi:hypothetical protein